jgi:transketolase
MSSLGGEAVARLGEISLAIRREIVTALHECGGGHFGGSLSVVDLLVALYARELLSAGKRPGRDRVVLSKGHCAISLYAVLRRATILEKIDLCAYGEIDSGLEGHPDMTVTNGVGFRPDLLARGSQPALGWHWR